MKFWHPRNKAWRYRCANGNNGSGPDKKHCPGGAWTWKADKVDSLVWQWLLTHFERPALLRSKAQAWGEQWDEGRILVRERREEMVKLLDAARNRFESYMQLVGEARDPAMRREYDGRATLAKRDMDSYAHQLAQMDEETALSEADAQLVEEVIAQAEAMEWRERLTFGALAHRSSIEERRAILKVFDVQVVLKRSSDQNAMEVSWRFDPPANRAQASLCCRH
jgi:hypothetical protein